MLSASVDLNVDVNTEDVLQAHRDRVKDAADLGFSVSQEKVPVDTGTLKQSGFAPEFRGDNVVFGYTAAQAATMEFGDGPRYVPIEPLMRWGERIGKGRGFGYYVATEVIPEEGIQSQPYLAPAVERMVPWLNNHGLDL
jgi:hypothetical protein